MDNKLYKLLFLLINKIYYETPGDGHGATGGGSGVRLIYLISY